MNISKLLQKHPRVWFYLRDDETRRRFARELTELGCRMGNGHPVTAEGCSRVLSVHADGTVCHVSLRVWTMSFQGAYLGEGEAPPKVDYARLADGEEDFLCHTSPFRFLGDLVSGRVWRGRRHPPCPPHL